MRKLYEKYNGYLIDDAGGYKSRDFKKFASYAKRRIKSAAAERNITLISFDVGHYDISGFLQSNITKKYAYFSLGHCRWEPLDFDACDVAMVFCFVRQMVQKILQVGGINIQI